MYAETSSGCFLLLFHLRCIRLDLNVIGLFEDSTPTETLIMLSRQNKFLKHLKHLIHLCINLLFFLTVRQKYSLFELALQPADMSSTPL